MLTKTILIELIGWVGTFFIPLGYYLNANKWNDHLNKSGKITSQESDSEI
mgnify:CR=1 FL=1